MCASTLTLSLSLRRYKYYSISVFNKKKVEGEVDKVGGGPAAAAAGGAGGGGLGGLPQKIFDFLMSVGEFWCILRVKLASICGVKCLPKLSV